jgi:DNA-binding transcriptional LysR family regulator
MDIRYFDSLIAVVEFGSIAQAARAQNLTAAAVGQRILALEKHFKTELLNRSTHKATPTEACLNLLPRARQIVGEFYSMNADIDQSGLSGKFHLGAISTALTGILPTAINQLAVSAPGLMLQIRPGTSNSLFADLAEGRVDAAIIALPPYALPSSYQFLALRDEPLVLISNQAIGHSIREKLVQNAYICYDSQSWGGLKARQYLKDKNIQIEPYYELDALETIEKLVQQGMGVSLVPQWAGLDLTSAKLQTDIIKPNRYGRRVVLVSQVNNPRKKIIETLGQALLAPVI